MGGSGSITIEDAGPPSISPVVIMGCEALCAKEATAACPNQGSIASCVLGCTVLLNNPACSPSTEALFACANTSTVSCDGTGKAELDSCPAQTLIAAACVLKSANDPSLAGPCTQYCTESAAAHCPSDELSGCEPGCQVIGSLVGSCDALWRAYVTCAAGTPLACGSDGKAFAPACVVQGIEYLGCAAQAVQSAGDAGQ
jgi:hypothetical protein